MWTSSSVTAQNFEDIYKYIDHFVPLLPLCNSATNDDNVSYQQKVNILYSDGSDGNGDNSSDDQEVIMID